MRLTRTPVLAFRGWGVHTHLGQLSSNLLKKWSWMSLGRVSVKRFPEPLGERDPPYSCLRCGILGDATRIDRKEGRPRTSGKNNQGTTVQSVLVPADVPPMFPRRVLRPRPRAIVAGGNLLDGVPVRSMTPSRSTGPFGNLNS